MCVKALVGLLGLDVWPVHWFGRLVCLLAFGGGDFRLRDPICSNFDPPNAFFFWKPRASPGRNPSRASSPQKLSPDWLNLEAEGLSKRGRPCDPLYEAPHFLACRSLWCSAVSQVPAMELSEEHTGATHVQEVKCLTGTGID
jgi:hypothetical protein